MTSFVRSFFKTKPAYVVVPTLLAGSAATWYMYKYTKETYGRPFNGYTTAEQAINGMDLTGKCAIVTGCNTGMGKETARVLCKQGCRVIMACRNTKKAEAARQDLLSDPRNGCSGDRLVIIPLDLSSLQSVRDFAAAVTEQEQAVHYLINNAGIMALPQYRETKDGFEMQFGVNHLGHFYLGVLLLPLLQKSKARLVSLSSVGHLNTTRAKLHQVFDRCLRETAGPAQDEYHFWHNYAIAKSCNILFAREFHRRYGKDVMAVSLHPGAVMTELGRHMENPLLEMLKFVVIRGPNFIFDNSKSIPQGAATTLRCVSMESYELKGGHYYFNCNSGNDAGRLGESCYPTWEVHPERTLDGKLWQLSEKLITARGFSLTL